MTALTELEEAIQSGNLAAVQLHLDADPESLNRPVGSGLSPVMHALYARQEGVVAFLVAKGATIDTCTAAALGRTDRLRELLEKDPESVHAYSTDGWTPLHLAAHFGRREAVELLLACGASVGALSANGLRNTPLHAALAGGAKDLAALLLDRGTEPNAADANGNTLLHLAAFLGDLDVIQMLLARGAQPFRKNENGTTPADLAAGQGHEEAARLLQSHDG